MPDAGPLPSPDTEARRLWMGLLARATREELEEAWRGLDPAPVYAFLRRPETGLAMVRGRTGGTGEPFNLGEMTMSRCAVRLIGTTGLAFVAGRDLRRAELAAVFDALLQDAAKRARIETTLVAGIAERLAGERAARSAEVAATRVNFFTLAREA